jgi:hypothetical protein
MKSIIKITLSLCVSIIALQACASIGSAKDKIVGNGDISSKQITTGDYDEVKVHGIMDVRLQKGTEGNISLKTDENLIQYLDVFVDGNALVIRVKKGFSLKTEFGIKITVPFEDLSKVSLAGSGDITNSDIIEASDFEINLAGSGDIKLRVNAREINSKIAGSGDVYLKGTCRKLNAGLAGSGDLHGLDLKCEIADLDIAGSGDMKVNASENIKVRIAGSGDVAYLGNPKNVDEKVIGSGTIKAYQAD